jgi:hypothetical protein
MALAVAERVPVDASVAGLLKPPCEALEQLPAGSPGRSVAGELAGARECELTDLTGTGETRREVRRGIAQRASELRVRGDLDAGVTCRHEVKCTTGVPPLSRYSRSAAQLTCARTRV